MNLKKVLFICLVAYSSSVDLLSVIPKRSLGVSAPFIGNEGLINSTLVRDLISTNSSSFITQMVKADPTQVKGIISALNRLITSVNDERKVFEDNVKTAQAAVNNTAAIHDKKKEEVKLAEGKVKVAEENLIKARAIRDNAVKELAYNKDRLANQVTIINNVIVQLQGLIHVTWYADGESKTYADMKAACVSNKKRLCYEKEVCPSNGQLVRAKFGQNNWSPIVMSNTNQSINYVQTGNLNPVCQLITVHHSATDKSFWMHSRKSSSWRKYYPCCV